MSVLRFTLIAGAALASSLSVANAATISHTGSFSTALTDVVDAPLDVLVAQFDTSLGTLTDVTVAFTPTVVGDGSYANRASHSVTVNIDIGGETDLDASGISLFSLNPDASTALTVAALAPLTTFSGITATTTQSAD
jgi:hypothetical protein